MRVCVALMLLIGCAGRQPQATSQPALDPRFAVAEVLYSDDFRNGTSQWIAELESGGTVEAHDGKLDIDVPAGCSVWFKHLIQGPVLIEYDATVIKSDGPNDRVSDLNCFWMATDARAVGGDFFSVNRSGKFADYNQLCCYYVGLGGNSNTTTRFRRYIGSPTTRPLLPEDDLQDERFLIEPNSTQKIRLIACGPIVQYWRNQIKLFEYTDPEPYGQGWFALRTVTNHMRIEKFRVFRLKSMP